MVKYRCLLIAAYAGHSSDILNDKLHRVFNKKFKDKLLYLEKFLSKFSYELVYTPLYIEKKQYPRIKDIAD